MGTALLSDEKRRAHTFPFIHHHHHHRVEPAAQEEEEEAEDEQHWHLTDGLKRNLSASLEQMHSSANAFMLTLSETQRKEADRFWATPFVQSVYKSKTRIKEHSAVSIEKMQEMCAMAETFLKELPESQRESGASMVEFLTTLMRSIGRGGR